jgi:hypothetical protein
MTKHFSPEPGATELRAGTTDYFRTVYRILMAMRETGPETNRFVRYPRLSEKEILVESKRPVRTELELLEQAEAESPENIEFETRLQAAESPQDVVDPFNEKELEKLFGRELSEKEAEAESEKSDLERDGKRRGITNWCNPAISTRPWQDFLSVKEAKANSDIQTCFRNGAEKYFRFPEKSVPKNDVFLFSVPEDDVPFEIFSLPGCCTGTHNRFRAWSPRSQFREHLPLPSFFTLPVVGDDTKTAAFNRAKITVYDAEFPQSKFPEHKIFGRSSRNGSPQYDAETRKALAEYIDLHGSVEPLQSFFMVGQRAQEMEMRPSPEEMAVVWNDPRIEYEVRTISSAPALSKCGYATPFYSLMKTPVSGEVRYWVTASKRNMSDNKLRRHLGNQGVRQENIDSEIKALAILERVSFENRGKRWALCSLGGMVFAPCRYTKSGSLVWRGELTDNGPYAAQDKLAPPQELECPGSDKKFWAPLVPRELSNEALPYDVDSEDELQFGYCFDSRSQPPPHDEIEQHDDINPLAILERTQERDANDKLLAPQSLRVLDALLDLAKNRKEIGRALSDDQTLGEKTYERNGGLALDETLADIRNVRQILTATGGAM